MEDVAASWGEDVMPCGEDVVRDGGGRRAEVEEVAALGWGRGGEGRAGVGEAAPGWSGRRAGAAMLGVVKGSRQCGLEGG
jgi:hypothetical protein